MDISSMLEVQVKEETDVKENVTPRQDQASSATSVVAASISQDESNFYKLMFGSEIASVRFRRIHCTACDVHIGSAPAQVHNMFEHPVLRVLLCRNCRDFYGDGTFEQGDDATDMFCRWCANGGNLYCCSYCSNTFCYKCIRRNFTSLVRKKIEADEKWKCFVCNPSDLYGARATCWALLQHVQTVTRILAHDKKMSAKEIEEKMNLDEALCCPRRSKRKRRRLESTSEEEDETYSPKANGIPAGNIKRKQLKKFRRTTQPMFINMNGVMRDSYKNPIPIKPRPLPQSSQSLVTPQTEPQSVISHNNSIVNPSESIVFSSPDVVESNTLLPSRFDSNALQQQSSMYHTSFMNTSGSNTYIQRPVTIGPTGRILLSSQPQLASYQPQQASLYQSSQPLQSSPNTMVSIPHPVDKHGKSLFLLPKPKSVDTIVTPNIIELDSDSDDELKVVQQNNSSINEGNNADINSASKVVPVALTWENSDDDVKEEQPLREMHTTLKKRNLSFRNIMLPHSQELDKLLNDVRKQVNDFDLDNAIENIEVTADQRIKHFYCNIRNTVVQLVHINDRILRQYLDWRRSWKTEREVSSSTSKDASLSERKIEIPLDMICVNESDTESDCEDQKHQITEPSDLIKNNNIVKDLLFSKKSFVHRGVGDNSAHLSVDKAVQVYDIVSRDYEKLIGYSMLSKSDHDPKTDDSVLNTVVAPDKNFGKYEEQFIFYLQHIEDNGIQTEDTRNLTDLNKIPIQELTTINSLFVSQLLQDIDSSVTPEMNTDQSKDEEKKDSTNNIISMTKDDKSNTLDINDIENVDNFNTNIQASQLDDNLQQTESQKIHADTIDKLILTSDNEASSSKIDDMTDLNPNLEVVTTTGSEEDCTIIDD
ncbi:uncharacterized protein LOC105427582 [Pogonomyrmex barbatus]|uniref:Uncharacterized protein LOC105427582 n=1 Tax=Pogonomyrmex barbatus TaxID=144034 RepID=A0A6I9X066_9HYME|nr:uncharacterized protein LOC105427582 [Pogonomyrmex barbatus]